MLNAFVLSPTKFSDLFNVGDPTKKQELEERHILFMEDGRDKYLGGKFGQIALSPIYLRRTYVSLYWDP